MSGEATHGWCPFCEEESAVRVRRRYRRRRDAKLSDRQLRKLHQLHERLDISARELARQITWRFGFASEGSALEAIRTGWRRVGLRPRSQAAATAASNRRRAAKDSPGTSDRRAYKRWLRSRDGGYRRCRAVRRNYPGKGEPCKHFALKGSRYCAQHDPDRAGGLRRHMSAMRAKLTEQTQTERSAMLRQGDVLLVPVDEIPEGLKQVPREAGRLVLAHGEATGHAHVIEGEATLLAEDLEDLDRRFLKVEKEVEEVHDEHASITVPPGNYEVRRQREYAPEAPVRVSD